MNVHVLPILTYNSSSEINALWNMFERAFTASLLHNLRSILVDSNNSKSSYYYLRSSRISTAGRRLVSRLTALLYIVWARQYLLWRQRRHLLEALKGMASIRAQAINNLHPPVKQITKVNQEQMSDDALHSRKSSLIIHLTAHVPLWRACARTLQQLF